MPRQNSRHFPDGIFNCICFNEIYKFRLRFYRSLFPRVHLTKFQHWVRGGQSGDKPLSKLMMDSFLTHICVTQPRWVKVNFPQEHSVYEISLQVTQRLCDDTGLWVFFKYDWRCISYCNAIADNSLQWRYMNVEASQIVSNWDYSTPCSG